MATLILSTVGTMAAGPVGGLLGTLVGSAIDQQLMGGGPRRGPRLGDLAVQTSSYGAMIPRVYGAMRVAGTVIWATDLKEVETLQGDGKSSPETVVYLYSASFAVALSSRPAQRIGRVWADGKLIRGAAGDLKVAGKMRFHAGSEDQPVDPLIASVEGVGSTPAYRGLALAVFEDLELAPFGNRIPNLTFEIVASDGGETLGAILEDGSNGLVESADPRMVAGYALYGSDVGSALQPLIEGFSLDLADSGARFRDRAGALERTVPAGSLGAARDGERAAIAERKRSGASAVPSELTIVYHDPARDYQNGSARAAIPADHRASRSLVLPVVSEAAEAKGLAETALQRAWAARELLSVTLPPQFAEVEPGDRLRFAGVAGAWRVEHVSIEQMVVALRARADAPSAGPRPADPGRPIAQPDIVAERSHLVLLDLADWPGASGPGLQLAVASPSGAYRPVPIEIAVGGSLSAASSGAREAVCGTVTSALPDTQGALIDRLSTVELVMANPEHWLESRDDAALAAGANLAAIGDEIVQFGTAEPLGPGRFRLSYFLRGRGGSEFAIPGHGAGEPFVLLNSAALASLSLAAGHIGTSVTVTAYGPANADDPPSVTRMALGEAVRPLSPCHLTARFDPGGALALSWIGRSRGGWAWLDGVEAAADGDFQGFRVTVSGGGGSIERSVAEPLATIAAADIAPLGPSLTIQVRQAGAFGLSRPASLTIEV